MSTPKKVDETAVYTRPPASQLPAWLRDGGPPGSESGRQSWGTAVERSNDAAQAHGAGHPVAGEGKEAPTLTAAFRPSFHLDLLYAKPEAARRLRAQARWKQLLTGLESRPLDPEDEDFDPFTATAEVEDARAAAEIMIRGEPEARPIEEIFALGFRPDGRFLPSVGLFAGTLRPHYDERLWVSCLVALASPFATDEELRSAVAEATALLDLSKGDVPLTLLAGAGQRIRRVFSAQRRPVPTSYVDEHAEHSLLRQRAFQRRSLFGGQYLRGSLLASHPTSGNSQAATVYLPDPVSRLLPLFRSFEARLIAQVIPRQDESDEDCVLRVDAIGRVIRRP